MTDTQNVKRISECIAPRGSYMSDRQKYSSYPFAFDRNCPYGVADKEIIDKDNIKVCQPHLPPFQNQYSFHSHFQDLFLEPECPSCAFSGPNPCNKTSNLNNNPECLQSDCLIVDPNATQFASIPMPVCFDRNTSYMLPTSTAINSTNFVRPSSLSTTSESMDTFCEDISMALTWILGIFFMLTLISYLTRRR